MRNKAVKGIFAMNTKFKKIVVASQASAMTVLVCSAAYGSDIELYKAPQTSQTTLMFMIDVSGSMNPDSNKFGENRLQSVKDGMNILLSGGTVNGKVLSPIEDKLAVGLSTFNHQTGRIKLEARKLNDLVDNKKIFKEREIEYSASKKVYIERQNCINYCDSNYYVIFGNSQNQEPSVNQVQTIKSDTVQECTEWDSLDLNCTNWKTSTQPIRVDEEAETIIKNSNIQSNDWVYYTNSARTKYTYRERTVTEIGAEIKKNQKQYVTFQEEHRIRLLRAVKSLSAINGTPTAAAYAEVASYMLGTSTKSKSGSGFLESSSDNSIIRNNNNYIKPATIDSTKQCNTQGIYFLTDGVPEYPSDYSALDITKAALNSVSFACDSTVLGTRTTKVGKSTVNYYDGNTARDNWKCIGSLAKKLVDADNPQKVSILTAVVGFGTDMSGTFHSDVGESERAKRKNDIADAKAWGELGEGGFYTGTNSEAVVSSVNKFLKILDKYIPAVTTGSVTIPVDNLDTQNIQPWGYFPQFDPQPSSTAVTWVGNVKKYKNEAGTLQDRDGKAIMTDEGISVDDPYDYWATNLKKEIIKRVDGEDKRVSVRIGGVLSNIKVERTATEFVERKVFTDRQKITVKDNQSLASTIKKGDLIQLKSEDLSKLNTANNFAQDLKRGYLAALFGYDVDSDIAASLTTNTSAASHTTFKTFLTDNTNAKLRQMGAVMHSKPILLTQSGKTAYDEKTDTLTYTDRDDLIVFGSTAGLLHVVKAGDAKNGYGGGEEVFAFAPSELIDKQAEGFLNNQQQSGELHYGIDAPWTAYTEYVTKGTGTNPEVTVKGGKQWIYGGLRMGGRSYYALDLSDVTSTSGTPKIKFKIDPAAVDAPAALTHMGESWSKPTITWVNWQGKRKLVMVVGGGYDRVYENPNNSLTPTKGAGIYMFDADNGDLLWWSSKNATNTAKSNKVDDLKYSVVSQIKAVDRNNDGLADHFYFGDLGGQLWRVDWSNKSTTGTSGEAARVTRILIANNGKDSPRFYTTPTFTIHNTANGYMAVVTVGSGDLSSPMSAGANENDAMFVLFDKDVTKRNLSVLTSSQLKTKDILVSNLVLNKEGTDSISTHIAGWYYPMPAKYRILNDHVAIDNDLYVSIFNANIEPDDVDCTGGVRGESKVKLFCLPYGGKKCFTSKNSTGDEVKYDNEFELGKGNIGISFGGMNRDRSMVLNIPNTNKLKNYKGKTQFISQRWYER